MSSVVLLQPVAALAASPEAERCGYAQELGHAREALAQGDRGAALIHLRRADALLRNCQEQQPSTPPAVEDLRAKALG